MSEFEQMLWAASNALQQEEALLAATIEGAEQSAREWAAKVAEQEAKVSKARETERLAERAPHAQVINAARSEGQPLMQRLWRNTGDMEALRSLEAIHNRDEVQQAVLALNDGRPHTALPFLYPRRALPFITGEGLTRSERPKDYLEAFRVGQGQQLDVIR